MSNSNLLIQNADTFAATICQTIADMVGVEVKHDKENISEQLFTSDYNMTIMIHFTGPIQGEYAICINESTVAKMIGCYSEGMSDSDLFEMREDYGGFIKEALNGTVGTAIESLSEEFEDLTFLPPLIIYGKLEYPLVPGGKATLSSEFGNAECFFVLNMMGLELGDRLQQTLKDLQEKAKEASAAKRNVEGMLVAFPSGMVIIDKSGTIQPGWAKLTPRTVGLDKGTDVSGMYFPDMVGLADVHDVKTGFTPWLDVAWEKGNILGFDTILDLCPIVEIKNDKGVILSFNWIPRYDEDNQIESLMVIIEDVTAKRNLEDEMKRLNQKHEQNMELVTQVLNLEPDEVTEFLYDSTGLLSQAKKSIKTASRDRQFIEELYRTVHTLKGNSGQFQFKGLQALAANIEKDLSDFKNVENLENVDAFNHFDFSQIDANLEEANTYLQRLEEMQNKLGPKEETLAQKAERNKPGIIVPFEKIDFLLETIQQMSTLAEKSKQLNLLELINHTAQKICQMREVSISEFKKRLDGAILRTAEKLNKKVSFVVDGDIEIDIEIFRTLHRGFVHLINNAIDHGIESPAERETAKKFPEGIISLIWKANKEWVTLTLSDDGRGIDLDAVMVRYNKEHPEANVKLEDPKLIEALFDSGFTTKDEVTDFSGRGVGLDAVKVLINNLGGKIDLKTQKGKGTEFIFTIPRNKIQPSSNWR